MSTPFVFQSTVGWTLRGAFLGALLVVGFVVSLSVGCASEREWTEDGAEGQLAEGQGAEGQGAEGQGAEGQGAEGQGAEGQGAEPASVWLKRLAAAHRALDKASEGEARRAAETTLAALVNGPAPAGLPRAQWTAVAGDATAHLSAAVLARGDAEAAVDWAARGLGLGGDASVFRAELFLAKGRAERALGRADAASASLFEALKVNQELLDRELEHP